jgi:hypothetical protein
MFPSFRYKPYMSYTFNQWIDLINYNWVALTLALQWCSFINSRRMYNFDLRHKSDVIQIR